MTIFDAFPSPWTVYREDGNDRVSILAANGRRVLEVSPGQHFKEPLPTLVMMHEIAVEVVKAINNRNVRVSTELKRCIATGHPCSPDAVHEPDQCPAGGFCRWRACAFDPKLFNRLWTVIAGVNVEAVWDKVCPPRPANYVPIGIGISDHPPPAAEPVDACCGDAKPGDNVDNRPMGMLGYIGEPPPVASVDPRLQQYHESVNFKSAAEVANFIAGRTVCGEIEDGA